EENSGKRRPGRPREGAPRICTLGSPPIATKQHPQGMPKLKQPMAKTPSSVAAPRMTTGEAAVAALVAHGIDAVYALPGVHNDPLFDALFKAGERVRTVHARHEQGAGYMALGAALATS